MTRRFEGAPQVHNDLAPSGPRIPQTCKRDCCWTPYGHSTTKDHLPRNHSKRCTCHDPKGSNR